MTLLQFTNSAGRVLAAATLVIGAAVSGCATGDDAPSAEDTATVATTEPATAPAEKEADTKEASKDPDSTEVESIDAMVERLVTKNYACRDWKQTDEVEGADASGTCNGKDTVMWFADGDAVQAEIDRLDEEGAGYVHGDNWIVANTATPTFVRNALGGTAVDAKEG